MGKRLIQQRRGRGTSTYRAHSFRHKGEAKHKHEGAGVVEDLISCKGHSAPLAKLKHEDGQKSLIIAPEGIKVGDVVNIGEKEDIKIGNAMALKNIPSGTLIYNIETNAGDGGKLVRSGGTFARILAQSPTKTTVLLPSKKQKILDNNCKAAIGVTAGSGRVDKPFLKAGRKFYAMKAKNKLYPTVSGTAMNAVDHPFGGKRTSRKGRPTIAPKYAPPGRKVGMIRPSRTGRKKR